ncbi:hypothetical protein BBJ28_00007542 [Nothophytophthora sp. Chile5]|nr:hypothetical protein BBJ28_00007542 [Nothophytophthora sp. Chile5]
MFEKVVESVLEEYVSEWVEGLDAEKMKVALFAGKVEFRDVRMRAAALNKFQLPLKMKTGTVGRLSIKVPWKRLTSQAVKIQVDDIFLVVEPTNHEETKRDGEDDDSYVLRTRWAKQQEVRMLELLETAKSDASGSSGGVGEAESAGDSDPTASWGYRKKILTTILDNVSFEFSNIHIRYEDSKQLASKIPIALGLTIDSIVVSTTNANGHAEFVDRAQSHSAFVHRHLEMVQASIYSDNLGDLDAKGRKGPSSSGSNIVHPFSTKVNLALNHDERTASSIPKLRCSAEISAIRACLTPLQSNFLICIANFISAHEMYLKRVHFQRNRPTVPVRSNAKQWWRYALRGVRQLYSDEAAKQNSGGKANSGTFNGGSGTLNGGSGTNPRPCDWKLFAMLWLSRKEYVHLHKNMLRAAKKKKLAIETVMADRSRLNELEDKLDVQTIVFFRLCAARELELEGQGHDSPRRLAQWKARWSSARTSSGELDTVTTKQREGLIEKLGVYLAVSDRMHGSSEARAVSITEEKNLEALLMALDLVVISFEVVLVEQYKTGNKSDTRDFLRFELNEFVLAVLQRTSSRTISSRITSVQILDFRQTYDYGPLKKKEPQALLSVMAAAASDSTDGKPRKKPFVQLNVDTSESAFRLDCEFERFRYIHNVFAASKLRAYFIPRSDMALSAGTQVEKIPALSAEWLRKTSVESAFGVPGRTTDRRKSDATSASHSQRKIEFSVKLPEIDVLIRSTDISADVEACLVDTQLRNGSTRDTFVLSVEGAEIFFLEAEPISTLGKTGGGNSEAKLLGGQAKLPSTDASPMRFELNNEYKRKRSTLLPKTGLVFRGEKVVQGLLIPKWQMTCTAPPIHLSLSSKQYQKLLRASADWEVPVRGERNAKATPAAQFIAEDERFNVCISIPQVLIDFQGDGDIIGDSSASDPSDNERNSEDPVHAMGFELNIKDLNVMARFSSVAQAAAIDLRALTLLKFDKSSKMTAGQDNTTVHHPADGAPPTPTNSSTGTTNPDPVYNRDTGHRTCKILEVREKMSVLISSAEPLLGEVKIEQVALYWDHNLLVALFRSYLHPKKDTRGNDAADGCTDGSLMRSLCDDHDTTTEEDIPQPASLEPPARFAFDVHIDRWFVFFMPETLRYQRMSFQLSGADLRCDISTLKQAFLSAQLTGNGGMCLASYHVIPVRTFLEHSPPSDDRHVSGTEETRELLRINMPVKICAESAGYGALQHRAGAGAYVRVEGSEIQVNYLHSHWILFTGHVTKDLAGFFQWVEIAKMPAGLLALNLRVKLEMELAHIKIAIPAGDVDSSGEQLDHMEIDLKHVKAASRAYPNDSTLEQNGLHIERMQLRTVMAEPVQRTQAIVENPEGGGAGAGVNQPMEKRGTFKSRRIVGETHNVFIEYVAIPAPNGICSKLKDQERENQGTKSQIASSPVDIDDIFEELAKMCSCAQVSLSSRNNWVTTETEDITQAHPVRDSDESTQKEGITTTPAATMLAFDPHQLELLSCLFNADIESAEHAVVPYSQTADEWKLVDARIDFGDLCFDLLDSTLDADARTAHSLDDSALVRVCLNGVQLTVNEFASLRSQYRVVSSKATFWKIDRNGGEHLGHSEPKSDMRQERETRTLCGDIHHSAGDTPSKYGIDISMDQRSPTVDNPLPPKEIRVHFDTCTVLPVFVDFGKRLQRFAASKPKFPRRTQESASPVDVSVSTGIVQILVAEYLPGEDKDANERQQPTSQVGAPMPLKMIVTGCIVVRYTTNDTNEKHVQLFGRKMSVNVASHWSPSLAQSAGSESASPSSSSPSSPMATQHKDGTPSLETGDYSDYHRIVCDDFTIDVDAVDTATDTDCRTNIAVTLTHCHAVLSSVDLFLLAQFSNMLEKGDDRAPTSEAESDQTDLHHDELPAQSPTSGTASSGDASKGATSSRVIRVLFEDTSATFVRQSGVHLSPIARVYSFCAMCKMSSEVSGLDQSAIRGANPTSAELVLQFSDESLTHPRDDDGISIWGFNSTQGSWEPIVEPWMFALKGKQVRDGDGEVTTTLELEGSECHPLNVNMSPAMFDSLCSLAKELNGVAASSAPPQISMTNVISSDCYLINDTGAQITYWVTHDIGTASRGFTYASGKTPKRELLLSGAKVAIEVPTSISPSLHIEETVSFSWGDSEWHPLTNVPMRSTGKYVYAVLPRDGPSNDPASATEPERSFRRQRLFALLDISVVSGYRTFTLSSLVRLFNETNITVDCGILGTDGKTIMEIGTIEPHSTLGVPIQSIPVMWAVRVFVKPHRGFEPTRNEGSSNVTLSALPPSVDRDHRWSNELFISEKEESTKHTASCSLVLDDYGCKCQRMFEGTMPFHPSEICKANGSFLHAHSRIFTSSNASSLQYAQMHLMPPLTLVNNCGVSIFAVMFAFKKVRHTAGAPADREYVHLVSSQEIPPHSRVDTLASALQDDTFCSLSMTGSSWSRLFRVPNASSSSGGATAAKPTATSTATLFGGEGNEVLCSLMDSQLRKATLSVAFCSTANCKQNAPGARQLMTVQPRFILRNSTALPLTFTAQAKVKTKLPNTKAIMARFPSPFSPSRSKQAAACCGSVELEAIHAKLNALDDPATSKLATRDSEQEHGALCYSEDSAITIQLEGNTLEASACQDFCLDIGANTSIRLFNEREKRWHDLVALFKQVEGSNATKVTFVERYLMVNRTDHTLMTAAMCDIALKQSGGANGSTFDSSVLNNGSIVAVAPHSTSEFSWWTHSAVPSDPCVRFTIQGDQNGDASPEPGKPGVDYQWSGKFSLHDVSETALKVSSANAERVHVLRIEVRVEAAVQVCVVVTSEDAVQFPLYRIINSCAEESIRFKQSFDGAPKDSSAVSPTRQRGMTQSLVPGESTCFGWDEAFFLEPLDRALCISYAPSDQPATTDYSTTVLPDQPGEAQQVAIPSTAAEPTASRRIYVRWYLQGVTKTVHIHDSPLAPHRNKQSSKQIRNRTAADTEPPTNCQLSVTPEISVRVRIPQLVLSLVNNAPDELLLFAAQDIGATYASASNDHDQCEVTIGCFQLDNQLDDAVFPVVIAPIMTKRSGCAGFRDDSAGEKQKSVEIRSPQVTESLPSTKSTGSKSGDGDEGGVEDSTSLSFFHLSAVRLCYDDNVDYIKYLSAMMQPARIQIDESFLLSLATFAADCVSVFERNYPSERPRLTSETSRVRSRPTGTQSPTAAEFTPERRTYIETLQLHPVKIQLSLTLARHLGGSGASATANPSLLHLPMAVTKALVNSTLSQIDSATLYLNALHMNHAFTTGTFMAAMVQQHYALQGMRQLYSLVGAADMLGNPVGLVTNLGVGVKDFFYEPAAGLVTSPQEFVLGLSRGTASLVTHSVYGAFNGVSKFTGSLSDGVATLSLDRDYLAARRAQGPRSHVATHIGTGLLHGTKQLGQGIFAGVTGVITAPAQGAYQGGLSGFIEGVGKGLLGVAVKPAAGVLDMAATTAAGITATTTALDRRAGLVRDAQRRRLPRLLRLTSDQRLRVYSAMDAQLSQLLLRLPSKYRLRLPNELYDAHLFLSRGRVLVVTSLRLLLLEFVAAGTLATLAAAMTSSTSIPPPQVVWSHPLARLCGAQHAPKGVAVHVDSAAVDELAVSADSPAQKTGGITTVLLSPLDDSGAAGVERVLSFVTELMTRHQRAAVTCYSAE